MSWAEIKKSINSDLSTPLDKLITKKTNDLSSQLNGVVKGANYWMENKVVSGTYNIYNSKASAATCLSHKITNIDSHACGIFWRFNTPSSESVISHSSYFCVSSVGPSQKLCSYINKASFNGWYPLALSVELASAIKSCGMTLDCNYGLFPVNNDFTLISAVSNATNSFVNNGCLLLDNNAKGGGSPFSIYGVSSANSKIQVCCITRL